MISGRARRSAPTLRGRLTLIASLLFVAALSVVAVPLDALLKNVVLQPTEQAINKELDEVQSGLLSGDARPRLASPEGVLVQGHDDEGRLIYSTIGGVHAGTGSAQEEVLVDTDPRRLPDGGVSVPFDTTALPEGWITISRVVAESTGALYLTATAPAGRSYQMISQIRASAAIGAPLLTALIAWLVWIVTGRALRPVESMTHTAATMQRRDRLPVPNDARELAELASVLNGMLQRLDDSLTRQERFVGDASHELRTPLATIRTNLELAQRETESVYVDVALRHEARLEGLLDDLLLLARLDETKSIPFSEVDLVELIREHVNARGSEIELDLPAAMKARVNPTLLERVLANLLDNAERHKTRRMKVALTRDSAISLTVDDDGPGIPDAERGRVLERFVRLDDARSTSSGGAGLGLNLCSTIVSRHGGSLLVGGNEWGGARLTVMLPVDDPEGH